MQKITLDDIANAITETIDHAHALQTENKDLRDRLLLAQSEALAAIQNKPKPEPRDIGHQNVVSFVTRKSGELQVSPGIVWGLVMDLIAKNPDHFGTDAESCPDPVEPGNDNVGHGYRVGDKVRIVRDETNPVFNGGIGQIFTISDIDNNGIVYVFEHDLFFFTLSEIEPYTEPVDEHEPFEFRVGDQVRTKQNGVLGTVSDIDSKGINGTRRVFVDTISTQWFTDDSLWLVCRMF